MMTPEVSVDLLDFLAFWFVTPELFGDKVEAKMIVYRRSRIAASVRRLLLAFFDHTVGLDGQRRTDAEVDDAFAQALGGGQGPSPLQLDVLQGFTQFGGGALFLALDYWLWHWFWHPVRYVIAFVGGLGIVFGILLLYVASDTWLTEKKLTAHVLWVGVVCFLVARALSISIHAGLL